MRNRRRDTECVVCDSDLTVELPFTLTHPKPPEEMMASAVPRAAPPNNNAAASAKKDGDSTVDPDLIHIDTRYNVLYQLIY